MNTKNECFKFMRVCLPPMDNGAGSINVTQNILTPNQDSYEMQMDFHVKGAHFSVPVKEIQSLYPEENASGNYANSIGHITLNKKTYPWENSISTISSEKDFYEAEQNVSPWLALICISSEEEIVPKEMLIKELFQEEGKHKDIFYPLKTMPICTETPEDICKVIDLTISEYEMLMPRQSEIQLLTHVKILDLYDKCDDQIALDGYFSVVVSNRFIPSGEDDMKKSTLHLVSLEGYDGYLPEGEKFSALEEYKRIRLVSLFSWDVYSTKKGDADFVNIMKNINSEPLAIDTHEILRRGQIPLSHCTRTGEETVSIYRGPLLPYPPVEENYVAKHTGDGRIIYDPEHGMMDLSYSAAWQLGRLLILKDKPVASSLLQWKKDRKLKMHLKEVKKVFQDKISLATKMEQGDIIDFWRETLSHKLIKEAVVTPISKDPKRRKEEAYEELEN